MLGRLAVGLMAWEGFWWCRRLALRSQRYKEAKREAQQLGRPLVVVGAPDRGLTGGYGCGDICIDIARSKCPVIWHHDISKRIPMEDDSVVVFCSCVLEFTTDPHRSFQELMRVSGGHLHVVHTEPWTLTAWLYPGVKHRILVRDGELSSITLNPRLRLT